MTILQYDQFYFRNGIRRAVNFINPIIRKAEDLVLPFDSEVHWFTINDTIDFIHKDYNIFNSMQKCVVENVLEYDEAFTTGTFRPNPITYNDIVNQFAKQEKKIKFLKYKQTVSITNRVVYVKNYSALTFKYRYTSQPLKRIHVYKNALNTVITKALESKRNVFIKLDLPSELPSRMDLTKFSRRLTNGQLKFLPNYKYFNVLELWKYINPEFKESSIFNRIPLNTKHINFLISIDNKVSILNWNKLNSFIEEYIKEGQERDKEIKPLRSVVAAKVLYVTLYKIINSQPEAEVDTDKTSIYVVAGATTNKKVEDLPDDEKTVELNIDEVLAKDIREKDIDEEDRKSVV